MNSATTNGTTLKSEAPEVGRQTESSGTRIRPS